MRDESAIGQILACPKCGSMVLVEAPSASDSPTSEGQQPSVEQAASQPRKTDKPRARRPQQAAPVPGPEPADEGRQPDQSDTTRPTRTFKFREDFDTPEEGTEVKKPRAQMTPAPPRQATVTSSDAELESDDVDTAADAPLPPAGAVSQTTRRYQQILMLGGAAVLGVLLAVIVVGFLVSRSPDSENERDKSAKVDQQPSGKQRDAQAPTSADKTAGLDQGADADADTQAKKKKKQGTQEPADKTPTATSGSDIAAAKQPPIEPNEKEDQKLPPDLAPPVAPDEGVGDVETAKMPPDEGAGDTQPPVAPETDTGADDTSVAATRAKLAETVVALQFPAEEATTLAEFARFIMDFTTVPVTLDLDALRTLGISPETTIEVDVRGVSVEQVLKAALEPLGVTYTIVSGSVLVAPPTANQNELVSVDYDIADLAPDLAAMESLARELETVVARDSWEARGGVASWSVMDHSLEVVQTSIVHFRLARLLDRLRVARGLLPRSDLPRELLAVPPCFLLAAKELNMPAEATFTQPTSLRKILRRLQEETDLQILIDWQELVSLDLSPSREVTVAFPEEPLHQLLMHWLPPLKLDYRMFDARTLQISSQAALDSHMETELYRLVDSASGNVDKLIAELKAHVGTPYFTAEGGTGAIVFNEPSQCLLIALPQPQQRSVVAWLRLNRKISFENAAADK